MSLGPRSVSPGGVRQPGLGSVVLGVAPGADNFVLGVRGHLLGLAQKKILHKLDRVDASKECIVDKVVHARVLATSLALGAVLEKVGALELELAFCNRIFVSVHCSLFYWKELKGLWISYFPC